jgi:hypothetical protein
MLSILLDPVGRHLSTNDKRDGDLADLGREAANFTSAYVDAVSDGKVTPIEKARLLKVLVVSAAARPMLWETQHDRSHS